MRTALLADASDLVAWAARLDSQSTLPELVRRLVHGTVASSDIVRANVPSGEAIQHRGWDGTLSVKAGNAFVPEGASAWEMSVRKDVKVKADKDYGKRTGDAAGLDPKQTTFVFVTLQRWDGKEEWVRDRMREGAWKEVRAYDADSLAQWLELAPAVHVWLSMRLGKLVEGAIDVDEFWEDWSGATRPPLDERFLLAGRSSVVERLREWFGQPPAPLEFQASTKDEALAVLTAAMRSLPPDERDRHLARTVIVRDLTAWRQIAASKQPLALVQAFDSSEAAAAAVRNGHRSIVVLDRAYQASESTFVVPRLDKGAAARMLVEGGVPEEDAHERASLAQKSLTSFRRKHAVSPAMQQPAWAHPAAGPSLVPALLAGAWNEGVAGDCSAIASLANAEYASLGPLLKRWEQEVDPPLGKVGDAWYVTSKEDAWGLLSRFFTGREFQRLEGVVLNVLGTPSPSFDLPARERWTAGALGRIAPHSGLLREGLADTLALMGARGQVSGGRGLTAGDHATAIVHKLLERANTDWRIWASLAPLLGLLAEASPDTFLAALEDGLRGERPVVGRLFADTDDALFSSSPHTGLLFALESLAWSPDHLGRVAIALGRLAMVDPGGKLMNRPDNSLRDIFLVWHPNTAATLDQRLGSLDALRRREPEVAWRLLCRLLPENHSSGRNTPTPRWRDWAPSPRPPMTNLEYLRGIREIASRVIEDVGQSGARWEQVLRALAALPQEQHDAVVSCLARIKPELLPPDDRRTICDALRSIVSHHRSFSDQDWALPTDRVEVLDKLCQRLEPQDLTRRLGWLFVDRPDLPEGERSDWRAYEKRVAEERDKAVRAVFASVETQGVVDFAKSVDRPAQVGVAFGQSELGQEAEDGVLSECLAADVAALAQFARGFVFGRVASQGREWAEKKLEAVPLAWRAEQSGEFLTCLPCDGRTWDCAERVGPDADAQYWRRAYALGIIDPADIERAVRKLLQYGRPYTAIEALAFAVHRKATVAPALIADVLEQSLRVDPSGDTPLGSFGYHASKLLASLEASKEVDEKRIAGLEWALLPVLSRDQHVPKLLHRELARDPALFAEVLSFVYRGEHDEPREGTPDQVERAQRAWQLLHSWRSLPGTQPNGALDAAALSDWVRKARELVSASGRRGIGDQQIGQALSSAPPGADGAWPHESVREVIEQCESDDLEQGFAIGIYNSRGVVSKSLTEGGAQERLLSEQYAAHAAAVSSRWPRTAAVLRGLASTYQRDAEREDQDTELRGQLGM